MRNSMKTIMSFMNMTKIAHNDDYAGKQQRVRTGSLWWFMVSSIVHLSSGAVRPGLRAKFSLAAVPLGVPRTDGSRSRCSGSPNDLFPFNWIRLRQLQRFTKLDEKKSESGFLNFHNFIELRMIFSRATRNLRISERLLASHETAQALVFGPELLILRTSSHSHCRSDNGPKNHCLSSPILTPDGVLNGLPEPPRRHPCLWRPRLGCINADSNDQKHVCILNRS